MSAIVKKLENIEKAKGFEIKYVIYSSIERRKTSAQVISTANHKKKITSSQWEFKVKTSNCPKRGKMQATKSRLVVVFNLIGWEIGASFLDRSQREVWQNQGNSRVIFDIKFKTAQ